MYLPGRDAIGRRIRLIGSGSTRASSAPMTIVGVAPSVRHTPATDASPAVYLPWRGQPAATMEIMLRSRGDNACVSVPVAGRSANTRRRRSALQRLDARAAVAAVTLDPACAQLHARTVRSHRDTAVGDGTLRRHDLQHLAADVRDRDYGWRSGHSGGKYRGCFSGARSCTSASASRSAWPARSPMGQVLRGVLVQTSALDPVTFASVVVLLAVVAVVACLVPTWRASALDPVVALRRD